MKKTNRKKFSGKLLSTEMMEVDGIPVRVDRKKIRSIRLKIHPENGQVSLSVPEHFPNGEIAPLVQGRIEWIREHQEKVRQKNPENFVQYRNGDFIRLWGKQILLKVEESPDRVRKSFHFEEGSGKDVQWKRTDEASEAPFLLLKIPEGTSREERMALVEEFYRIQLEKTIPQVVARCEARTGLHAEEWRIRKMKTRWGSCNWRAGRIWLNLQLAVLPLECLEYVIFHELCHLLEPSHNARFYQLMDQYSPGWRTVRESMR